MTDTQTAQINAAHEEIAKAIGEINALQSSVDRMIAALQHAQAQLEGMGGNNPPQVTIYNQRDPRWANVYMGTTRSTIGNYGCLISCVASGLTDAGKGYTPETLNAWLTLNKGYINGNYFVYTSIDRLGVTQFVKLIDCTNVAAPVADLDARVAAGDFVIVEVDFNPNTVAIDQHWVRYIGGGQMVDPWVGDIAPIVPRYRGKDAAQAILKAAIYRRLGL